MNVKIQNEILKFRTFNSFQGGTPNNIHLMQNFSRHLIWALDLI
jgi:hypothetical protein